jgi:hypothetical protein
LGDSDWRTDRPGARCHPVPLVDRVRYKYWIYRWDIDPWVLLLIRKGPRGVWRRLSHAPVMRPGILGWSTVARGLRPDPDVRIALYPMGKEQPNLQFIDPLHVRAFLAEVLPGRPLDPHLAARVAMTEEHGPRSPKGFTGYELEDYIWLMAGDLRMMFSARGRLSISAASVHRPPSADSPLFDVVDVLLPLYVALVAVSSGACDRLLGHRGGRRRYQWELQIEERIVFPTPLAEGRAVGFPDRVPASIPLGGHWREPSQIHYRGWDYTRLRCRPERVVESVLAELLTLWATRLTPWLSPKYSPVFGRCAWPNPSATAHSICVGRSPATAFHRPTESVDGDPRSL